MADIRERWASPKEVANRVGVDQRTVRRWAESGLVEGRVTPGGREWRIRVEVDGWPHEPRDDD